MARPRMRPSFTLDMACNSEDLMTAFRSRLPEQAERLEGEFSTRHGVLRIRADERQFWSPTLDLTIDAVGGGEGDSGPDRTRLWGTFSPRPEIWTAFVFAIGTLVIASVFSGIYGVAQLMLGHLPWALLVPVFAILLAALIYTSALVGQGLSIADMYALRAFVDDCQREAEASSTREPRTAVDSAQL